MNNPKLSPQDRRFLSNLACKYLKHLQLYKTLSDHTSKSYAKDLSQFLFKNEEGRILFSHESDTSAFECELRSNFNAQTSGTADDQILDMVQCVLNAWAMLSPASRNRKITVLRGFLVWLFEQKVIESDWSPRLVSPKVPQKIPHFLSVDEVMALLECLRRGEHPDDSEALLLVLLLYGGGLRVSEACQAEWKNLKPKEKTLRVLGKGGNERLVILPDLVWQALAARNSSGPYIWGSAALDQRKAFELVRQAGRRADLSRPLNPHALRHSIATHLLSSGTDLRILQELLGHKTLTATQKYTHLSLDNLARSMEAFHPLSASKLKKGKTVD